MQDQNEQQAAEAALPGVQVPWPTLLTIAALVFVGFFAVFGTIKMANPGSFSTMDDPYFHARYAALLAEGVPSPPLPYVSTLSWFGGGSLYTGYHQLLALAIRVFGGSDDNARLIVVSKLFNAALSALVLAVYMVVAVRLLARYVPSPRTAISVSALSLLLLLVFFPAFEIRLFFERPFLVGIALLIALVDALLAGSRAGVFFVGLLLTFFYSFSLIAAIPIGVFLAVTWWLARSQLRAAFILVATFVAGYLIGIALLPNPVHYVVNGLYAHLFALLHAATVKTVEAAELAPTAFNGSQWLWLVLVAGIILFLMDSKNIRQDTRAFPLILLSVMSVVFLPITMLFERGVEYFGPFAMLAGTGVSAYLFYRQRPLLRRGWAFFRTAQQRVVLATICLFVLFGMAVQVKALYELSADNTMGTQFAAMYAALRARSVPGDKVFLPVYGDYPSAFFYAPELSYNQGMEPSFTYVADQPRYWVLQHAVATPDRICAQQTCTDVGNISLYEAVHGQYGARFVAFEYEEKDPVGAIGDALVAQFAKDDRFDPFYDRLVDGHRYILYEAK